jgi:hypothetical protein
VELDRLEAWIGEWESTGEVRPAGTGRVLATRGVETLTWECDRRFVLERMRWETEGGGKEEALAVRTWDPHARRYRSWYFDSNGMVGHSWMTYDAPSRTWRVETEGSDPETCEPTAGRMTIQEADRDTLEWSYTEFDGSMRRKRVEMSGTSRRRSPAGAGGNTVP